MLSRALISIFIEINTSHNSHYLCYQIIILQDYCHFRKFITFILDYYILCFLSYRAPSPRAPYCSYMSTSDIRFQVSSSNINGDDILCFALDFDIKRCETGTV